MELLLRTWKVQQASKKRLFKFSSKILIFYILPCSVALATAYTNPGNASAPQTLNTSDTFTNTAGIFQSTGTEVSSFGTVQVNSGSTGSNTITLTSGAITATGTSTGPIATVPLFGANTASTTITMASGTSISSNTTQASTVAMAFTGPIALTNSGGTITGSITAGAGSSFTQATGTTTGAVTLGTVSSLNLSSTITGALVVGAASTITLGGSASITGGITGNSSTLVFTTGGFTPPTSVTGIATLNVNSGTFTLSGGSAYSLSSGLNIASGASLTINSSMASGAAATTNLGTLTLGVANALPTGTFTHSGTILNVGANTTLPLVSVSTAPILLTVNGLVLTNNGTFTTSGNITGTTAGTVANGGTMNYNGGTLTNIAISQTGNLNISVPLTATSFSTSATSNIYIIGSTGQLNHAITSGNLLYFGQNSSGVTTNLNATYSTGGAISNVPTIRVFGGSTLNVAHTISNLTGSFTVDNNATLNINQAISGSGGFSNAGVTTLSASINSLTGPFSNTRSFNVATTWTPGSHSTVTNTGNIFLPAGGVITVPVAGLSIGGTLNVGRTSTGTNSTGSFTAANAFTIPSINVYNASTITGTGQITSSIFLCGTQTNPFTGSVKGNALTIGMDSFGNAFTPTVTITNAIGNTPTTNLFPAVYVAGGTLTTSGAGAISNLNTTLYIGSGATFNAGASVSGSSQSGSNSGLLNIASTFDFPTYTNANGGRIVLQDGASITSTTTLNNNSSPTGGNYGLIFQSTSTNNGTISNTGTIAYTGTLVGTGTINNQSGGTITFLTTPSNTNTINNLSGGTLNFPTSSTNTGTINNASTMNVTSITLSGAGTINNLSGGALTFTSVTNSLHAITNNANATFTITGGGGVNNAVTPINNAGLMYLTGTLTGTGTINNNSGGTLTMTNGITTNAITNAANATLIVNGTTNGSAAITNSGTMSVAATLTNTGVITNNNNATLTLATDTSLGTGGIANTGSVAVTGDISTAGNITNGVNGRLTIGGDINMSGTATITSTSAGSSVTVSGNQTLTSVAATSYTNSRTHNTTITSEDVYDSLSTNGTMNLTGATINITPYITNTNGDVLSFTILSAGTITGTPTYTGVSSDFYRRIQVTPSGTQIVVSINAEEVTVPINVEIAGVLQNMFNLPNPNSGQQALENAFLSISRDLNESLHQMIPISNAFIYDAKMQGIVYNKVESRLAGLRNGWDKKGTMHHGISAGDVFPGSSVWMSVSGSLTEQGPDDEDDGYNAKTGVALIGRDFAFGKNVLGVAGGYSFTHLKELSNQHFIDNISRWHVMGYGTYNFKCNNYWDWLITTNFNSNHTHRDINVSGSNMTTYSSYHAYQLAGKILRGKGFDFFESYRFTPFTFAQYAFIHQDAYSETGSVAALSINSINKNILTLGLGTKFDFPLDAWSCIGMRELRAAVVYDVINNNNNTTANFVVGSNSFTVTSTPVRLGLQLGAGIAFEFANHLVFELNYDFEARSHFTDNTFLLKMKYVF